MSMDPTQAARGTPGVPAGTTNENRLQDHLSGAKVPFTIRKDNTLVSKEFPNWEAARDKKQLIEDYFEVIPGAKAFREELKNQKPPVDLDIRVTERGGKIRIETKIIPIVSVEGQESVKFMSGSDMGSAPIQAKDIEDVRGFVNTHPIGLRSEDIKYIRTSKDPNGLECYILITDKRNDDGSFVQTTVVKNNVEESKLLMKSVSDIINKSPENAIVKKMRQKFKIKEGQTAEIRSSANGNWYAIDVFEGKKFVRKHQLQIAEFHQLHKELEQDQKSSPGHMLMEE